MAGFGGAVRHRSRGALRMIVATAVVAGTAVWISMPQRAEATLPGSVFNGADASPTSDLAAGAIAISDPVGNQDSSNYTGGTENDVCPPVQNGTASPKDDLDAFYFGTKSNSSGAFLYVAWHRASTNGTTTIDFEVNRAAGVKTNCNGVNPPRTAGDILITYDFVGSGPFLLDIHQRTWVGDSNVGAWSLPTPLAPGSYEASINGDGSFGEMVVNLTLAGALGTVGCDSFATVFPKSRSSSQSFTNAIKEFVPPKQANVSNCGSIPVHKQDDAGTALANVVFDLYTNVSNAPGSAVEPAQSCTTNASGDCTVIDVYPGTYWLVERAAPIGHTGADPQKVVVTLDGNTPAGTRTFVNPRKPARVNIQKHDDLDAPLAGAGFTLYTNVDNAAGSAVADKGCTTNGSGQCSITGILPPGLYWVVETTVPAGHTGAIAQQVDLELDETVGLTFENARKPATVNVVKTDDAEAPLAGAGFTLYTDGGTAPGTAVSGKTCTTTSAGTCSITGILPAGTYWVVETTTPAGYTTAPAQEVDLDLDETVTLTFVDDRKPAGVNIVKKNDAGAALAGAGFTLYTDNEGAVGSAVVGKTCTTGVAGTCSITGILPAGDYWVVETTTPVGHYTAAAQRVEDLDLDETVTLTFENVRKPIGLSLVKTVDGAVHPESDPLFTESGQEVTYELTVKNTGELPLTITALTDSLNADVLDDCEQGLDSELAAGAEFTCSYTASPTEDAENEASVTGTDVLGRTTSADDEAFVIPLHPAIKVVKTGPSGAHVGDVVVYTFTVTNPGDTGLTDVTLTDAKCADAPELQSTAGGNDDATLDPGETWTFTCEYTVVDGDGASVTNEVEVAGTDKLDTTVTSEDEYVFPVLRPAISIDKSASPESVAVAATVTFTYVVTNTGNTTLFDISVDDDVLGHVGDIASLEPGQSRTLLASVTVAEGSPTVNIGTAVGSDRLDREVKASDRATITLVLGVTIDGRVDLPRTGLDAGLWLRLSSALVAVGLTLVVTARRRRSISIVGQSTSD